MFCDVHFADRLFVLACSNSSGVSEIAPLTSLPLENIA